MNHESPEANAGSLGEMPARRSDASGSPDLICLSHLRWDFVYQRPQHLLTRCARDRRVFFVEEPVFGSEPEVRLEVSPRDGGVTVVVPHLPEGLAEGEVTRAMRALVDDLIDDREIRDYVLWYYTPMARAFTSHLAPRAVIYDCMDELSAFKNAPPALRQHEAELFEVADHVFTGGQSLYEAKRDRHPSVHAFPSSIDRAHFAQAREAGEDPADQAAIARPRFGFFGVVDERFDVDLIVGAADARPEWQFVVIGPVVKIDPATLPQRENVHYLGGKSYAELPAYLAGWDVAILPFARNESTRFISPTKTPEYLAAGKPVISTSIRDVVRPYGERGLVRIADTPEAFVAAGDELLASGGGDEWLAEVDAFLAGTSWDETWGRMAALLDGAVAARDAARDADEGNAIATGATAQRAAD